MTEANDRIVKINGMRRSIAESYARLYLEGILTLTEAVDCLVVVTTQYANEMGFMGPAASDCILYVHDAVQRIRKKWLKDLSDIFGTDV